MANLNKQILVNVMIRLYNIQYFLKNTQNKYNLNSTTELDIW